MERTHKDSHTNAEELAGRAHTRAEAARREAIFHCYYERAGERSANTADLHGGSPLATERARLTAVACCLLQMCICTSETVLGSDL